jgi:hypothetical protein
MKTLYNTFYGDETRWWVGKVESVNDPIQQGRVKVRIYGVHSASVDDIGPCALPWAQVLAPSNMGGVSGVNGTPVGIQPTAQVFGIFLDGKHSQLPLVIGSIPQVEGKRPELEADPLTIAQQEASGTGGETAELRDEVDENGVVVTTTDPALGGIDPDAGDPRGEAGRTGSSGQRTTKAVSAPYVPPKGTPPTSTGGVSAQAATPPVLGNTNPERIYNFLEAWGRQKGLKYAKEIACGFVGNFMVRSTDLCDPLLENSQGFVGIAQWNSDRHVALMKFAYKNAGGGFTFTPDGERGGYAGMSTYPTRTLGGGKGTKEVPGLRTQLQFVAHELSTARWLGFEKWAQDCSSAKRAADRVEAYYDVSEFSIKRNPANNNKHWKLSSFEERQKAGHDDDEYKKRLQRAEEMYRKFVIEEDFQRDSLSPEEFGTENSLPGKTWSYNDKGNAEGFIQDPAYGRSYIEDPANASQFSPGVKDYFKSKGYKVN